MHSRSTNSKPGGRRQSRGVMFTSPPYITCPKCHKKYFGINLIHDYHYTRRCGNCGFPGRTDPIYRRDLPSLSKQVIYLDQFVFSNMMKAINKKSKSYGNQSLNRYKRVFQKLDRLCKMQLIVCPESSIHTHESILSNQYEWIKRMIIQLSCNVSFHSLKNVRVQQLIPHAICWLKNEKLERYQFEARNIVYGKLDAWQGKFSISSNIYYDDEYKNELRTERGIKEDKLKEIFMRWQSELKKTFEHWYKEEVDSVVKAMIKSLNEYFRKNIECRMGRVPFGFDIVCPPEGADLVLDIQRVFEQNGVNREESLKKSLEYFGGSDFSKVPYIDIQSMLFAGMARKAATGQRKPPNRGFFADVNMISVFLPYCDAILIDNECAGLLRENPIADRLSYNTKIFSTKSILEFLDYLDKIENATTDAHLLLLEEVYGPNYGEPYNNMFDFER